MATEYSGSQVTGYFKDIFADNVEPLVPESAKIQKMFPYKNNGKNPGELFSQPLQVQADHGFTYALGSTALTAFTLNDPIAATFAEAQIPAAAIVGRGRIPYAVAARATDSKQAFGNAAEDFVEVAMSSFSNRLEISMLHGGRSLGVIESIGTIAGAVLPNIVITAATWSAGIFSMAEGAAFDVYDTTLATKRNVNPNILSALNVSARSFTLTGTVAGDVDDVVATDEIFFLGTKGAEQTGLIQQVAVQTGTVLNINKATYSLYRGSLYSFGGPASFAKISLATAAAVVRGLSEDVVCFVNPTIWENINGDQAALRVFDSSYSSAEATSGSKALTYYGQNGKIELEPHIFMKQGEVLILPKKRVMRIGSSDITMNLPGRGGPMLTELASNAGYEFRLFSEQHAFLKTPAKGVYGSGITVS